MNEKIFKSMIPCCVVSPTTHATGLGAIRSLAENKIPVVSFDWKKNSLGRFSNYCYSIVKDIDETESAIVNALIDLGKQFSIKPVLFITSDELTLILNNHRLQLREYFHFIVSEKNIVNNIVYKEKFYQIAAKSGIPIPKTWFIQTTEDFFKYKSAFVYPCIIKPTTSQPFRSIFGSKVLEIHTEYQYFEIQSQLQKHHIQYILQEIIPGNETRLYTFGSYSDKNANALSVFTGRKLRQFPPDYGGCRFGESVYNKNLIQQGKQVLKAFHFQGISQIEFKLDTRDGLFKLIELNVRGWTWDYLATATGSNFYLTAYHDILGKKIKHTVTTHTGYLWHNMTEDLLNCIWLYKKHNYPGSRLSIIKWLQSFMGKKRVEAFFRWDDPFPFLYRSYLFIKNQILKS